MALDFPASPSVGQNYTSSGIVWQWDGAKWINGMGVAAYAPIASPVFTGDPRAPTPAAGDNDTSLATTAFVAPAFNDTGRNLLHNPLFNVAQRGAGPWTTAGYTLDRWRLFLASDTDSVSMFAMNDANRAQIGDEAALRMLLNTFTGNAAAGAQSVLFQYVESVYRLSGKTVTVSFYAQAGAVLKLGVSLDQNFGTGGSPSASVQGAGQSVTLSINWARYSLTFVLPSNAGKVLGTNGDDSTSLNFWFSSGATNAVRAGNVGVQSGTAAIWGVQLEVGSVATPLEKPDPRYDFSNCQRFYRTGWVSGRGYALAGQWLTAMYSFSVPMRAAPTLAIAPQGTGNVASAVAQGGLPDMMSVMVTLTATGDAYYNYSFTASADL